MYLKVMCWGLFERVMLMVSILYKSIKFLGVFWWVEVDIYVIVVFCGKNWRIIVLLICVKKCDIMVMIDCGLEM